MARCDYCKSYILFGGRKQSGRTFCNDDCLEEGRLIISADRLPQNSVDIAVDEVHQGDCPNCNGPGPIDVHVSHTVWSAVYLTSWKSKPHLSCRSCGRKEQFSGMLFSGLLGWWGFPWGLIMAPVQICRNISGMIGGPSPEIPSDQLETMVRIDLAERAERGMPLPGSPSRKPKASAPSADDPIKVECDACGRQLKVKAKLAGRKGKCPDCGSSITVPDLVEDFWEDDQDVWDETDDGYSSYDDDDYGNEYAEDYDERGERPARRSSAGRRDRRPQKPSASKVIVILGAVTAGLFLVGLVAAAGILIFGGDDAPQPGIAPPQIAQNNPAFEPPDINFPDVNQAGFHQGIGNAGVAEAQGADKQPPPGNLNTTPNGQSASGAEPSNGPDSVAPPAPVKPLPNVDASGRLWVVLSNLRAAPEGRPTTFNRPFRVDYQLASGAPQPNSKYVLHVTSKRGSGLITHYVDVPVELQASGTVEFVTPPTFGPGNEFVAAMALSQGRNKWDELSGTLSVGGAATVAEAPPTIQEAAGAAAQGKTLAIANPELSRGSSAFPTLSVSYVLQQAVQSPGFYFLIAEQQGGQRVEIDVSISLRQATVGEEGALRARLVGPGAQIQPPLTLYVEKRRSPIPSPIRREEPETVSNKVTLNR